MAAGVGSSRGQPYLKAGPCTSPLPGSTELQDGSLGLWNGHGPLGLHPGASAWLGWRDAHLTDGKAETGLPGSATVSADNPFTVLPTGQSRVCIHPCFRLLGGKARSGARAWQRRLLTLLCTPSRCLLYCLLPSASGTAQALWMDARKSLARVHFLFWWK